MSQYIYFFIKGNTNEFIPLVTYSRSSAVYSYFKNFVPYDKVKAISINMLHEITNEVTEDLNKYNQLKNNCEKEINRIQLFKNNTAKEKLDLINLVEQDIAEYDELITDVSYVQGFITVLTAFINNAYDTKYNTDGIIYDSTKFLYAGIETGDDVTIDMIEDDNI